MARSTWAGQGRGAGGGDGEVRGADVPGVSVMAGAAPGVLGKSGNGGAGGAGGGIGGEDDGRDGVGPGVRAGE